MLTQKKHKLIFDHLECTKKHIIVHFLTKSYKSKCAEEERICIIDKETLKTVDTFEGKCPTYMDNYKDWYDESLKFLSECDIIEKMSVSLLKIILSYVA